MRIGCLQFAPQVGDVDNNLNRADEVLSQADPEGLDLLVLPELAFSGYNFKSLQHISPFLEPPSSGISSLWSRSTALKYECVVVTGYPEKVDTAHSWPADPEYYNSTQVVSEDGETIANYRKSHLYYTDETWALEGQDGFYQGRLPRLGQTAMGICMDLNPYKFEAPWTKFEFANHVLDSGARLVVVSMAWLTNDEPTIYNLQPQEPDIHTLMYWVSRFEPLIQAKLDEEVIIVFANRSGMEGEAVYAGTSAVVGIQNGEVHIYGILGRGDKDLLVVDTDAPPFAKLVHRMGEEENDVPESCSGSSDEVDNVNASQLGQADKDSNGSLHTSLKNGQTGPSNGHESHHKARYSDRRGNLSINVSHRHVDKALSLESPAVHTPTAPSPTPYQLRPQIRLPSAESRLQNYLDTPSPTQREAQPSESGRVSTTSEVRGPGEVTNIHWHEPGCRSSISSIGSSLQYWMPSSHAGGALEWPDNSKSSKASEKRERPGTAPNAHSDVPVWNSQQGRPPSNGVVATKTSPKATTRPFSKSTAHIHHQRSASQRPSTETQRQISRTRVLRRSNSATAIQADVPAAVRTSRKVSIGNGPDRARNSSSVNGVRDVRGRFFDQNTQHPISQQPTPIDCDSEVSQTPASRSIALYSVTSLHLGGQGKREPSAGRHSARGPSRGNVTPILRPASLSRIRSADPSNGELVNDQTPPRRRRDPLDRVQNTSSANADTRATSRGRQRESKPVQGQSDQGGRKRSLNSRTSQSRQPEPVDLAQFRLIEEYPSANCPVHGSRSRSGTGVRHRRNTAGSRSRAPDQRQQPTPERREADKLPPTAARHAPPSRSTQAQSPERRNLFLLSNPTGKGSPKPKPLMRAATVAPGQDLAAPPTTKGIKAASKPSIKLEPKTPVAMVLFFDREERIMTPLKCSDRGMMSRSPIARPRSAVW